MEGMLGVEQDVLNVPTPVFFLLNIFFFKKILKVCLAWNALYWVVPTQSLAARVCAYPTKRLLNPN